MPRWGQFQLWPTPLLDDLEDLENVTAGEAGYESCPSLILPRDGEWEFVPVGEEIKDGDEFWNMGQGPWKVIVLSGESIVFPPGVRASAKQYPIRRRKTPIDTAPAMWSCRAPGVGHRKEIGESRCPICAALYDRIIDT